MDYGMELVEVNKKLYGWLVDFMGCKNRESVLWRFSFKNMVIR